MVGVSILPVAIHKNKLYFLFGKEKVLENGIRGFSDFGGGKEDESIFEGAIREGCEELTGFLGTKKTLKERIKKAGGTYQINFDDKYYSHIFLMDYDENLPLYYNNNHDFLWEKMNNKHLSQTKFFEKMKIEWFTTKDMKKRRNEFRPFFREFVDRILKEIPKIRKFLKKNKTKRKRIAKNKTYKNH
tara:strand:- start:563 stop:1123 length:561 start_codon:yes stop_codon:yes gene_type:complete